ncbi:MAG TPA: DUF3750 domain-containing protein [Candidatus Paceibacterota bacterium]|nr:DUF3750 domain-containing protein [Candidatus Paceibacterota bacterium]
MPLSFARHPWFVVNKKGAVSRFEVSATTDMGGQESPSGHLCVNALPLWEGLPVLRSLGYGRWTWSSRLVGIVEGDESSLAARMIEAIEHSPKTYLNCYRYAYTGPNSNTYAQWVLNQFPEASLKLPWNSFGKRFVEKLS